MKEEAVEESGLLPKEEKGMVEPSVIGEKGEKIDGMLLLRMIMRRRKKRVVYMPRSRKSGTLVCSVREREREK